MRVEDPGVGGLEGSVFGDYCGLARLHFFGCNKAHEDAELGRMGVDTIEGFKLGFVLGED